MLTKLLNHRNFGPTVKELTLQCQGSAPGFDALRLVLATLILCLHCGYICYPDTSPEYYRFWSNPIYHPIFKMILPMFFFLSGYLVSSSAYRLRSIPVFIMNRVLRIIPALVVEVCISAVILGAVVTRLPLEQYYSSPSFLKYFLNIVGNVQFLLPGVFVDHPNPIVNANLWTLPGEFYCYLFISILMFTRIFFSRKYFLIFFLMGNIFFFSILSSFLTWGDTGLVFVRTQVLIYCFFVGAFCHIFADLIPIRKSLFVLSFIGLWFFNWKYTIMLGVLSSCYLCLCIGFLNLRKFPLAARGDFSYGVYLYGFPIQQAVWHFLPIAREWWILFLFAFPITLLFSIFSWKAIEEPILHLKKYLNRNVVKTPV